ncbi:MAG: hypothetical protein L0G99_08330 [Propionibacteriales bacterium]|nr:hypothetical protein [Propionibacteriales bacterium]
MSRMAEMLTIPHLLTIPEPLERAWTWLEAHSWADEQDGTWVVAPPVELCPVGPVFLPDLLLDTWLEDDSPANECLLPIAQLTASGDVAAMWRDAGGVIRFVALGADQDTLVLADSAVDFLRMIASEWPPEFREWVEASFDVTVPDRWTAPESDAFTDWMALAQNDELEPINSQHGIEGGEADLGFVDLPAQRVIELAAVLSTIPFPAERTDRSVNGIAVTSTPQGHLVELVHTGDFVDDRDGTRFEEAYAKVGPRMEDLEDAALARWGEPEIHQLRQDDSATHLDQLLTTFGHDEAAVWRTDEKTATVLFSGQGDQALPLLQYLLVCPATSVGTSVDDKGPTVAAESTKWRIDDLVGGASLVEVRDRVEAVGRDSHVAPIRHADGTERHGWSDGTGAASAWWFTPDGRAMMITSDQDSTLNLSGEPDAFVRQLARYDGVHGDLAALARNRGEELLPNYVDGDETVHAATGIFHFDGEQWCIADGLQAELTRRGLDRAETGVAVCLSPYGFDSPSVAGPA